MVQRRKLKNGLRVVYEPMEHVRSLSIGIWVYTGSRDEKREENGITHFLEHMLFKGTKERSAMEIAEAFDRIGGSVNAFTAKEYTCFYAKVIDKHAREAIDILSDMFFNSTFYEEEIVRERDVVLEEIRMVEDTADDIVHDDLDYAAYGNHPLGLPILGTERTVPIFNRDHLYDYISKHYRPDNIVVSIAGKIDDSLLSFVESQFAQFSTNEFPSQQETPHALIAHKAARAKSVEQAHLCLGFNGVSVDDDRLFPMALLNQLLGGSMSSRLFQEIREERGLAYAIFSHHIAYRDGGMLSIYAGTAPEKVNEVLEAMLSIIDRFAHERVSENDMENVKSQVQASLLLGLESTTSRMSKNGKNELSLGFHRSPEALTDRIDAVTSEDIQSIAGDIYEHDYALSLISPDGRLPRGCSDPL
ncbi:putative Zn-dependent peptidase [Geomicrobium halophilum]|uniref:Putative Zn-dependent peptidase n=1 Tax=Geomicrobium halophilum TaxID=549000 RepID=A0A841PKF2_9BACL|nr:pitrilysin family protein [Geomicrobium halophilum]MBB6449260.1 putative Zn-dependent peptidase [Geomicrobium halophilum]